MAATSRTNAELQRKAKTALNKATDPIEKLRLACLSRGASGIKGLGRTFKIFDDDGSRSLDFNEFKKGLRDYGLHLEPQSTNLRSTMILAAYCGLTLPRIYPWISKGTTSFYDGQNLVKQLKINFEEVKEIFEAFDKDGSKQLDFDEFLIALRPPMSKSRKAIVSKAFNKLDRSGDGVITVEDLKGVYDVTKHPKYKSGEWSEERCFKKFLECFDTQDDIDGVITLDEFMNYYSGVSASIDNDAYFDLMIRSAYKM